MAIYNLFNEAAYLKFNPDVAAAVQQGLVEARVHFEQFGRAEGRTAGFLFNPEEYLALNLDVAKAVAEGLLNVYHHFEVHGIHENRAPFAGFDIDYYLAQNADVAAAVSAGLTNAVEHFMTQGYNELRNFNPQFDIRAYLEANPDAAAAVQAGQVSAAELLMQHLTIGGDPVVPGGGGSGGGAVDFDVDAIMLQLTAMLSAMGAAIDVKRIQTLVLESGLVTPENLNADGTGLKDPQPLVELLWKELLGVNPIEIIGGLPELPVLPV